MVGSFGEQGGSLGGKTAWGRERRSEGELTSAPALGKPPVLGVYPVAPLSSAIDTWNRLVHGHFREVPQASWCLMPYGRYRLTYRFIRSTLFPAFRFVIR